MPHRGKDPVVALTDDRNRLRARREVYAFRALSRNALPFDVVRQLVTADRRVVREVGTELFADHLDRLDETSGESAHSEPVRHRGRGPMPEGLSHFGVNAAGLGPSKARFGVDRLGSTF